MIKGYHANNGIFNNPEFMEEQLKKQKNIRFSGASASHKNGSEERNTKMVFILERIMLM